MVVYPNRESIGTEMKRALPDPEDLRRLREKSDMAQVTIAMRMKIAPSYLCDLEQGRRDWNADLVARFVKALKGTRCL